MFPAARRMIRSSSACAGNSGKRLPERERLVMTLYYYEELIMKEIGMTLGVVESRVSQIHSSAVVHLRADLRWWTGQDKSSRTAHLRTS